ncbi:1841_t:CDS:10, partial [Diversispora eburnea]
MTRYTNLEKKKFEKAAGFNVSPLIPEQGKTQEVASKESEEKIEHKKKSPINNKKRTLDNEEINNIISVKEENNVKSERRRLRRIRERHSNTICYGCREQGHSVRDCPIAKEKGVGICYNCGSAEHTAKDCRRSSNANKYQYAKCFVCNEQGHLSSKCPKNEKGLYPNGGGCRFCGKVDHLAKDCTLKKEVSECSETLRLSSFLEDCLSLGCLKGFKHFEVYLRGREELLLRVYIDNNPIKLTEGCRRNYNSLSLVKSHNGEDYSNMNFLPSSPLDKELEKEESNHVFLIAGYAKYKCPYVWLRSNHKRLIQLQDNQKLETDNPLKLETIAAWNNQEVITLSLIPQSPENPFKVDHSYYDTLPLEECAVSTAFDEMNDAMNANTLEKSNPSSGISA